MAGQSLEERVTALEEEVERLQRKLRSANGARTKDWRRTIGAFTDDEGMRAILADAMKLREADRGKTRARQTAKRK
jgi:hypothetical protein